MRRVALMLAVAMLMAAMIVASAVPAMASRMTNCKRPSFMTDAVRKMRSLSAS
jgi:hypothetical protein